ncbi:MAG TPA: PAS domain S-box protein [Thermoanaerobaculia bacterium]
MAAAPARPAASEHVYRALMDTAIDAICIAGQDTTIIEVNPAAEAMFERTGERIVGRTFLELLAPEERDRVRERFGRMLERGSDHDTAVLLRGSGERFRAEVSASRVQIGEEMLTLAIIRDVSERARAEQAVADSERRYRELVENAPIGIYRSTRDGRFLSVNAAFARKLGYATIEEVLALDLPTDLYWDPKERERLFARSEELGGVATFEVLFKKKDGTPLWIEMHSRAVRNEAGETLFCEGFIRSIHDRKRAEENLRRSEEQYRLLFEANPHPMWVFDTDTLRFLAVNESAERDYGYSRDEFLAMTIRDIRAPEVRERLDADFSSSPASDSRRGLCTHRRSDGTLRDVEVLSHPLDFEGRPARLVLAHDVTDQIAAERELRRSRERLRLLSRRLIDAQEEERHRIARELHDEIGQALTALKINLLAVPQSPEGGELASRLADSMSIVEQSMKQVRDMSLALRPSLLDDLGLVPALRWYAAHQAERAGFELQFESEPAAIEVGPEVAIGCYRVVQEALNNVARHARAKRVRIALACRDGKLQVSIEDDGAGFEVEAARSSASRNQKMGLLSMTERTRLLGGRLRIDSGSGQGTRINAFFPTGI